MPTEDEVRAEVHALWTALFGEPPIVEAAPAVLLDVLIASLPKADYTPPTALAPPRPSAAPREAAPAARRAG